MSKDIIQLNEEVVKSELKELVRSSVEETLNELLDKEADGTDQCRKVRAHRGASGLPIGALPP